MLKASITGISLAGIVLAGSALAQQSQPTTQTAKPSTSSTAHKTTTAAKKTTAAAPLVLKTDREKASYAIGTSIGRHLKDDELNVDTALLYRAIRDALAGKKPPASDQELAEGLMNFQKAARAEMAAKNLHAGEAYLVAFKAKPGVVTLPDGLAYKVLQQGTGPMPTASDEVVVNYRGTFVDGKEFDSSYKRNEPLTIPVGGVIKGWTEALEKMPVGSKWELVIPPSLAYGERERQGMPPNSTLVFEVELLKIAPKKAEAPEAPGAGTPEPSGAAPKAAPSSGAPSSNPGTPGTSTAPAPPTPAPPNTSAAPTANAPQPKR